MLNVIFLEVPREREGRRVHKQSPVYNVPAKEIEKSETYGLQTCNSVAQTLSK